MGYRWFPRSKILGQKGVNVTKLARGVPVGSEIHYLDDNTLGAALESRKDLG